MNPALQPTACVMIIGNEILSGKTQDANLQFLGVELAKLGIKLVEARVVRDDPDIIVTQLNECRAKYTYVFTTGGIGPTHDDITAECVARAFGVPLVLDDEAVARLRRGRVELNAARLPMARPSTRRMLSPVRSGFCSEPESANSFRMMCWLRMNQV